MESGQELNLPNVEKKETREARDGGMSGGETRDGEMKTPNTAMMRPEKSGAKKGMIIGMVCLAVAAVVGCAFGTYAMVSRDGEIARVKEECANASASSGSTETETTVVTCPDGNEVEVRTEKIVDVKMAQNLVKPYLGAFAYIHNIFDHDFNEGAKFFVAFNNLDPDDIYYTGNGADAEYDGRIEYSTLNSEYQYLFGNGDNLNMESYNEGYYHFEYRNGAFVFKQYGGGGAGLGMFSVIKDVYYDGEDFVVNMYHDVIPMCFVEDREDDYCLPGSMSDSIVDPEEVDTISDLMNEYADRMPVYKMVFMPNAGHYVLSDIQKQ